MKIIETIQGTNHWKTWRKSVVTATDASIILGKNPFKSRHDLWEVKMGLKEDEPENEAMKRGSRLEPEARDLACKLLDKPFKPLVVVSEEHPFMGASLDGYCEQDGIGYVLEIKCPNFATHVFALEGGIHNYYMAQMQHQMAVTKAPLCYYMSYRPEHDVPYKIIEVHSDPEYINELVEAEQLFYVEHMCQPFEPDDRLFKRHP